MTTIQAQMQRLSGTTLAVAGAANAWAGTSGLALVGALNAKAGTTGLPLQGVLNRLAGTTGLGPVGAASAITAATTLVTDTFTRADNATSLGTATSGQVWSQITPAGAAVTVLGINSNQAASTVTADRFGYVESGQSDVDISADALMVTSGQPALLLRFNSTSNEGLLFRITGTAAALIKTIGGTVTSLNSVARTHSNATTYRLRAVIVGNSFTGYVDGVQVLSYTLAGGDTSLTGTKVGIRFSGATGVRFDNLTVTTAS